MSTDNSIDVYKKITKGYNNYNIVVNTNKDYALKNIAKTISAMEPRKEDIIIVLDADDWLSSPDVLSYLNTVYQKQGCWLTYGSYMYYPFGDVGVEPSDYPQDVVENNLYREDNWRASHLRTFKKKLWDKINQQDLVDDDGEYYKMAYDQAMMLPMLEMAREKAKYIPEVLHVYNRANSINVDKQKRKEQYETMLRIRKRKKYERVNFED
jgi:glycosyltransferase involved in cell wall biosynthesis